MNVEGPQAQRVRGEGDQLGWASVECHLRDISRTGQEGKKWLDTPERWEGEWETPPRGQPSRKAY